MTSNQSFALWHLRRNGLQLEAEGAELAWARGHEYLADEHAPLSREILQLIEQCNWEVVQPKVA